MWIYVLSYSSLKIVSLKVNTTKGNSLNERSASNVWSFHEQQGGIHVRLSL